MKLPRSEGGGEAFVRARQPHPQGVHGDAQPGGDGLRRSPTEPDLDPRLHVDAVDDPQAGRPADQQVGDTSLLIIGPATTAPADEEPADAPDTDGDPDEPVAWFGDDLTDPDPSADSEQPAVPGDTGSLHEHTSLVVASWPLDATGDATNRIRLAWLLAACTRLLRPGGCLVLVVAVPTGAVATPEDFTPVVEAAKKTGLGYLQHIVAVTADTDGDQFTYPATDEELLALARASGAEQFVIHVTVHADLLVFSQSSRPQTTPRTGRARRQGGGRRG